MCLTTAAFEISEEAGILLVKLPADLAEWECEQGEEAAGDLLDVLSRRERKRRTGASGAWPDDGSRRNRGSGARNGGGRS
jgi:hypothetical protein